MSPLRSPSWPAACALSWLAACAALAAPAPPAAPAPEDAKAKTAAEAMEEAPPIPPQKLDPQLFNRALQDFFIRDTKDASRKLYQYVSTAPQTDENYAWAEYFLARSLLDLGFRHAAGYYLAKVARERSNPAVLPRALEELRTLTDLPHNEVMIDEQVFGTLDLGFLPESIAGYAHYQQGLLSLKVGNERWALTHFSKLAPGTAEASHARFVLGVTRLKSEAEKVPSDKIIREFADLGRDDKLDLATRNDAHLAVARLRYERKEFDLALEAYEQVKLPELDPGQATLYLEEAWTRYQLGQVRAAMGLLTTLDAPKFRDEFLPDKYLLRAMIFRDLCHYLPAKRAAKELTRRFADSLEAIRERQDLTQDLRLKRAAESHGPTRRASEYLDQLKLEAERIGRYAGSFEAPLVSHLTKLYSLEIAEGTRVHDERLADAVREEADNLLRAAEQVRLMEYEVGLKLYERVKHGAKLTAPEKDEPIEADQVAFTFEGEYWNDELRDYRYSINSRCIEEGGR